MLQLNADELMLAVGAGCFVVGLIVSRLLGGTSRSNSRHEDPRNHRIRELEADLRSARRQMEELEGVIQAKSAEFNTSVETLQELRASIAKREARVAELETDLKESVAKTNQLRRELQDRATETVREQVRAEEAVTELEVARAGSEAVMSEIARLQQERQRMSENMQKLSGSLLMDEELFGSDN